MSLKLEVCTDADMDRAFAIVSSSFGHEHPYIDACYPDHDTELGRKRGGERMLAIKNSDPNTTFIKVVDGPTGNMIALGKWNVYKGTVPEEADLDGDFWQGQDDKEYAQYLFREYLVPRRKAIKDSGGRLVSLDITTVDPDCQKRGAGRMIVKWGTAIADELGFEVEVSLITHLYSHHSRESVEADFKVWQTVVEASDYAQHLYESEGFKSQYNYVIDLPDKWAGRDKQRFIWMVRPAKGSEKHD